MRRLGWFSTVAQLFALISFAAGEANAERTSPFATLTDNDFDSFVTDHPRVLVEFYAAEDENCATFEPEFVKAGEILKEIGHSAVLAQVDVKANPKLAKRFSVDQSRLPSLWWLNDDRTPIGYTGHRTFHGILRWLHKRTGGAAEFVATVESVKALEQMPAVVIGCFKDIKSESAKSYWEYAEINDDIEMRITNYQEVREYLGMGEEDSLVLLKNHDEPITVFRGPFTLEAIDDFLSLHTLPLVSHLNQTTQDMLFNSQLQRHVLLMGDMGTDVMEKLLDCYTEAARQARGELLFFVVDMAHPDAEQICNFFNLEKPKAPQLLALDVVKGVRKYVFEGNVTCQSLRTFWKDFLAGTVPRTYSTAPLPADWDTTDVKTLVGSNYNMVANQLGKCVFVKIYAPWCTHCQEMEEAWRSLAQTFKGNSDVVIAELDGTRNEVEGVWVEGYPNLRMYVDEPPDGRKELVYTGQRTFEAMKAYVEGILAENKAKIAQQLQNDLDDNSKPKGDAEVVTVEAPFIPYTAVEETKAARDEL